MKDALLFSIFCTALGIVLAIILLNVGTRSGSLLYKKTPSTLQFRRRLSGRVGALAFGIPLLMYVIVLSFLMVITDVAKPEQLPLLAPFFMQQTMWVSLALFMIYLGGPHDTFLDLDKRTYQVTYGWPINPKIRSGPFEEIKGIDVCEQAGRERFYIVQPRWQNALHKGGYFGRFRQREQAEQLAIELSEITGIAPIVSDVKKK